MDIIRETHYIQYGFPPPNWPPRGGFFFKGVELSDLHATMLRLVRDDTDLTSRQLVILMECGTAARTVRSLSTVMNVPKPAITRSVDRLEELGLAERRDDPDDRRSVLVALTARGRKFVLVLMG